MSLQADYLSGGLLPPMPDISRLSQKNERGVSGKTRGKGGGQKMMRALSKCLTHCFGGHITTSENHERGVKPDDGCSFAGHRMTYVIADK